MSQDAAQILTLTRSTYASLLPVLRNRIGPGLFVFAGTFAGGLLAGPPGVVGGAAAGSTLALYANEIIAAFRMVLLFLWDNPMIAAAVAECIVRLTEYLRNRPNGNNQLEDQAHHQ